MKKNPNVILLIEATHSYGRALLQGIAKYSYLHGPWSFYREPEFYGHVPLHKNIVSQLKRQNANGLIIREPTLGQIEELMELNIPMIISPNRLNPVIPTIVTNAELVGQMAADHLLERGFKHFAYCGYTEMPWSMERFRSFSQRIAQQHYTVDSFFFAIRKSFFPNNKEQTRFVNWLKSLPRPVGMMTCNDDMGRTVLEACKSVNIPVPEQIAVVGVDDDELTCGLTEPPLSSVALHSEKVGYRAAELLDRLMQGEKMNGQIIAHDPSHVVTRQSTDVIAVDDPDVSQALLFIRQHFKEPITVDDVANKVALSTRHLYKKFITTLGHTVHQEIKQARIEHICKLLIESDLSIYQITLSLGFASIEHISRYFRQEKGMSLQEFRKKFRR